MDCTDPKDFGGGTFSVVPTGTALTGQPPSRRSGRPGTRPPRRTVSGVPVGMLKMKYSTPAAASSSTRATSSSGVPMSDVVGSSPVTWRRKSFVAAVSSSAAGEHEGAEPADGHLGRVAADRLAVAAQDVDLVGHRGRVADDVAHVGVAGHEPQRPLLAAAADQDGRPAGLHRRRHVARLVDPVVAARRSVGASSVNMARQICSASSRRSSRSPAGGKSKPSPSCSTSYQAAPMPRMARPPLMTSSVVTILARCAGLR